MDITTLAAAKTYTDNKVDEIVGSGAAGIVIDPTLSKVGYAADAKATGEKLKEIYEAIEQREILKVVKYDETGITERIGQENEIKALQDCTVITVPYESSSGERGAISLFGPTRMEYNKIIPLLEYIAINIKNIV